MRIERQVEREREREREKEREKERERKRERKRKKERERDVPNEIEKNKDGILTFLLQTNLTFQYRSNVCCRLQDQVHKKKNIE